MEPLEQAEQELISLKPQPFYVPLGNWAPIVAGAFLGFSNRNWIFSSPRARVGGTLRGVSVQRLIKPSEGARPYKLAPSSFHPARRALQAVGSALVTQEPTLCILGDAALAHGEFFQALNLAGQQQCPVIFLLIRFPLDDNAPIALQQIAPLSDVARAHKISYNYAEPTTEAIEAAVQAASNRLSPTLIETTLEK